MNTVRLLINGKKIYKEVYFTIGIAFGKNYVSVTALTKDKDFYRNSSHIDIKEYISPHSEKVGIAIYFPDGTIKNVGFYKLKSFQQLNEYPDVKDFKFCEKNLTAYFEEIKE